MSDSTPLFTDVPVHDDAAHWDALAARVTASSLRDSRADAVSRFGESRAAWLVAASLLFAALAYLAAPALPAVPQASEWSQALAPADDVGRALAGLGGPPAIGALVLAETTPSR